MIVTTSQLHLPSPLLPVLILASSLEGFPSSTGARIGVTSSRTLLRLMLMLQLPCSRMSILFLIAWRKRHKVFGRAEMLDFVLARANIEKALLHANVHYHSTKLPLTKPVRHETGLAVDTSDFASILLTSIPLHSSNRASKSILPPCIDKIRE